MNLTNGKPSSDSKHLQTDTSQLNGSHVVTLTRNLENNQKFLTVPSEVQISSEYHLTARVSNSQLGPRELSLICEVLEYQIVHFGVNFGMMLALSELYFRLLGNKRNSHEINQGKIRTVVTVAEILLKAIGSLEYSLDPKGLVQIPDQMKNLLSPYLMDKRTYGSRYKSWRPEKWIRVLAVPVSTLLERDPHSGATRYSGYTKGYGESHGNAHKQKTKPSTELDGEKSSEDSEERNLKHRVLDSDHQPANSLWIKFTNWLKGD